MTPMERARQDIAKHGFHVIHVFDPENKLPSFTYSVGIQETTGKPEAIVIGLPSKLSHSMIANYFNQVKQGKQFERGVLYPGFLDGFSIYMEPAKKCNIREYTLGCFYYYGTTPFKVIQLVYPTTQGIWTWDKTASDSFKQLQPMLGRKAPNKP